MRILLLPVFICCCLNSAAAAPDLFCIYGEICQKNKCEQLDKPMKIRVVSKVGPPVFLIPVNAAPPKNRMPNDLISSIIDTDEMVKEGQAAFAYTFSDIDPDTGSTIFQFSRMSPTVSHSQLVISSSGPEYESTYYSFRKTNMFTLTSYIWRGFCKGAR